MFCRLSFVMLVALIPVFPVLAFSSATESVSTSTASTSAPVTQHLPVNLEALARDVQWQYLLHFRPTLTGFGQQSQSDDARFLLTPEGVNDPTAELRTFWQVLNGPAASALDARCQFPARYEWLLGQIPGQIPAIPESQCVELDRWIKQLNAESLTLVFAASYLNSPSSMFGHTFLRIDPPDLDQQNLILANTISYAADSNGSDNELEFAYRGIFGGYPGITTVEPYYQKVRLYSDLENRDLWEYRLNLTPAEVHLLIRAAWEIKDKRFDYFFFDENCAYRLLALIDIARPRADLINQLAAQRAIPSDTVRVVVKNDLVESIGYRPSVASTVSYQIDQLSIVQQDIVESILETPESADFLQAGYWSGHSLAESEIVQVLEVAYDLVRYRAVEDELPRDPWAALSFNLLKARSRYAAGYQRVPPPEPQRDDTGHVPLRMSLQAGEREQQVYLEIEARPAYHSLTDPTQGYRKGAHLEFLSTAVRWYPESDDIELEHLKAVEIFSFSPRSRFFDPLSWHVGFGGRRSFESETLRPLTPYLEGGAGPALQLGNHLFSLLLKGEGEPSSHLPDGGHLEVGGELHWLYLNDRFRAHLLANSRYDLIGENDSRSLLSGAAFYELYGSVSVGLTARRDKSRENYANELAVAAQIFF